MTDGGAPRRAPAGGLAALAAYTFVGVGAAVLGIRKLAERPDLPWDYAILFALGAVCLAQAWRRWHALAAAGRMRAAEAPAPSPDDAPSLPSDATSVPPDAPSLPSDAPSLPSDTVLAPPGGGVPPQPQVAATDSAPVQPTTQAPTPFGAPAHAPKDALPAPIPPTAAERRSAVVVALQLLAGLGLVVFGQIRLEGAQAFTPMVWIAFGAGAALWLAALARSPAHVDGGATPATSGPPATPRDRRVRLVALGLVAFPALAAPLLGPTIRETFGLITIYPDGNNTLTQLGGGMWLLGVLLYVWSVVDWAPIEARWRRLWDGERFHLRVSRAAVAVLAITALGAWFRFHDLADLPLEMTSDHTEKLVDIGRVVDGLRPVFLPANAGREPMQFYWTAFLVWLGLPLAFITMKIGMALVSTATIPAVYRLGREVAGRETGLLAALILAVAPWHIQITRIALRIAFAPLWVALLLWALYRALGRGGRNAWVATGLCLGLGTYGYTAFRPIVLGVPLVIALKMAHDAMVERKGGGRWIWLTRDQIGHLVVAATTALVLVVPLARYAYEQPVAFNYRMRSRITEAEVAFGNPPTTQLFINMKNALSMFNLVGDSAWFQSPAGRAALETVGAALFVLGLVVVLHRVARRDVAARDWRAGALVLLIPLMLLSSALALAFPIENPSLSRASGALPMVVVICALPLPILAARWRAAWGPAGTAAYGVLLLVLFLWAGRNMTERYFGVYRTSYDNSTHNTLEGAAVIRAFITQGGDIDHAYYVGWENGWDFRALAFLLDQPGWNGLVGPGSNPDWSTAAEDAAAHVGDPARKLYLVGGPSAERQIETLKGFFPNAIATLHASRMPGKDFWSVFVPDAQPTPIPSATAPAPPTAPAEPTGPPPDEPVPPATLDSP